MKTLSSIALIFISIAALSAQASSKDPQVVKIKLWDQGSTMGITTDDSSVKAGKVTFAVENDSKSLVHEMLVVKEDKVDDLGEVSELEPNQTGTLAVNLKPGHYLLVCNMPGHYKMRMFTQLTVTPEL